MDGWGGEGCKMQVGAVGEWSAPGRGASEGQVQILKQDADTTTFNRR